MLIRYYKAIEDGSSMMLEAARSHDWDGVVRYEGVCAVLIEQLKFLAKGSELSSQEKREKSQIMLRILQNDAEIRTLVEPWLADIGRVTYATPAFLH